MICVTTPTGGDEPEGFEVEARWMCEESQLEAYATEDGRIFCIEPTPTGGDEPEGFEVEARWMCEESQLEAYATEDGRIFCIEPEEHPAEFVVEDRWECFDIGG